MCADPFSLFSHLFTATFPTTGTASVCQARRRACGTGELNIAPTVWNMFENSSQNQEKGKKNPLLKPHDWPDGSLDQASHTHRHLKFGPACILGFLCGLDLEFEAYLLIFNMAPVVNQACVSL